MAYITTVANDHTLWRLLPMVAERPADALAVLLEPDTDDSALQSRVRIACGVLWSEDDTLRRSLRPDEIEAAEFVRGWLSKFSQKYWQWPEPIDSELWLQAMKFGALGVPAPAFEVDLDDVPDTVARWSRKLREVLSAGATISITEGLNNSASRIRPGSDIQITDIPCAVDALNLLAEGDDVLTFVRCDGVLSAQEPCYVARGHSADTLLRFNNAAKPRIEPVGDWPTVEDLAAELRSRVGDAVVGEDDARRVYSDAVIRAAKLNRSHINGFWVLSGATAGGMSVVTL